MRLLALAILLTLTSVLTANAQRSDKGEMVNVAGLITPRDDNGMYVRNPDGQFEIEWTKATEVELKKTRAKLIWVTTCPVPRGFPPAGDLTADGEAPRRTSGVMEKFLNPWALEVMKRHPEISICDQWQFVKDQEADLYKDFWAGDNVHFGGEPAAALGRVLADHVLKITRGLN